MRVSPYITLFLLLLIAPATAQEIELGTGLICDTQRQVERVVALMDTNAETAVNMVNAEEHDPAACVVLTVAYLRGAEHATVRNGGGSYQIVEIMIVGVVTGIGLQAAMPQTFYTLFAIEESQA